MKKDECIKLTGTVFGELFAVGTIAFLLVTERHDRLPLAVGTLLLVLLLLDKGRQPLVQEDRKAISNHCFWHKR